MTQHQYQMMKKPKDSETEPTMVAEVAFAQLADWLEKKIKLLDDKNKECNQELDRAHDKIRKGNRVGKEFVGVISDKIKDIATPKMLDMKQRIRLPIFKGGQGGNSHFKDSRYGSRDSK